MFTSKQILDKWNVEYLFDELCDEVLFYNPFVDSDDTEFNKRAIVHWWMNIYPQGRSFRKNGFSGIPQSVYRSWSDAWEKYFKYCHKGGGYFLESKQEEIALEICKDDSIEKIVDEINYWLPYYKQVSCPTHKSYERTGEKRQGRYFHVCDKHCSYNGVYALLMFSPDEMVLNKLTHSYNFNFCKFTQLKYAVSYLKDRYFVRKCRNSYR